LTYFYNGMYNTDLRLLSHTDWLYILCAVKLQLWHI